MFFNTRTFYRPSVFIHITTVTSFQPGAFWRSAKRINSHPLFSQRKTHGDLCYMPAVEEYTTAAEEEEAVARSPKQSAGTRGLYMECSCRLTPAHMRDKHNSSALEYNKTQRSRKIFCRKNKNKMARRREKRAGRDSRKKGVDMKDPASLQRYNSEMNTHKCVKSISLHLVWTACI